MTVTPYTPTPFAQPVANPAMGGAGQPYPYISVSEYNYAPTAMDTSNLVPTGSPADQIRATADTIRRASSWADQIVFGADMASKGCSLCASISVETDRVTAINGELRLMCDYKPLVEVLGVDIGFDMSNLSSVGPSVASQIHLGRRTIHVPIMPLIYRGGSTMYPAVSQAAGTYVAVWSYVNGYPHTQLAAPIAAGATSCQVLPTDGGTGLVGIVPGVTRLTIRDGTFTESFTVGSVSGTTLTLVSGTSFAYAHTPPAAPDSLMVSALPAAVEEAVILLTTVLIKTRGDNSLVLEELTEPKDIKKATGDEFEDLNLAVNMLMPFRVRYKAGRR